LSILVYMVITYRTMLLLYILLHLLMWCYTPLIGDMEMVLSLTAVFGGVW
jgi:hypothetical protein